MTPRIPTTAPLPTLEFSVEQRAALRPAHTPPGVTVGFPQERAS